MKKVEIIGAAIVDVLVSPADKNVFETGSSPAEKILMTCGGDALNEAVVLHRLGGDVHLSTVIGRDAAGETVQNHMKKAGLDTGGVVVKEGLDTSVNVVLVQPDGKRSFLTCPESSQRKLQLSDIDLNFAEGAEILSFASIFVFPLLGPAELETIFRAAKEKGLTVCADMTKRKKGETSADLAQALRYVDYLIPNDEEAMLLTGADSPEEAAEALLQAGVGTVIVKCGSRGALVKTGERTFWAPAETGVRCVDTTGAGDSFTGGFLYGLSQGLPLEDCMKQANFCGARAVERVGATSWIL
ncbi:MAG: carbohydrate kinase family protein [Clostridiales bacterium]|nr:carbohydrate kinase family protein [Clostridiales bacterium]